MTETWRFPSPAQAPEADSCRLPSVSKLRNTKGNSTWLHKSIQHSAVSLKGTGKPAYLKPRGEAAKQAGKDMHFHS